MLETGLFCMCCGQRKLLHKFPNDYHVCDRCCSESEEVENDNQRNLALMYATNDSNVQKCKCERFFIKTKLNKLNQQVSRKECNQCRIKWIPVKTEESGSMVDGGLQSKSIKKRHTKTIEISPRKTEGITKKTRNVKTKDLEKTILRTEKKDLNKEGNGPEIIGSNKMKPKEDTTEIIEVNNSVRSSQADGEEILPLDSNQVLRHLREESSATLNCLNASTEQLMSYATQISNPRTDYNGEVIKNQTVDNMMNAVKCLEAARNNMKTKLEYLKYGKSLVDRINN